MRQYCAEGVTEAETCGDVEMQAEFLLQGVLLNMLEGVSMEDTYAILCSILHLLDNVTQRSTPGELLRTVVVIHMVDMEAVCPELDPGTGEARAVVDITKRKYIQAQEWLLEQVRMDFIICQTTSINTPEHCTGDVFFSDIFNICY